MKIFCACLLMTGVASVEVNIGTLGGQRIYSGIFEAGRLNPNNNRLEFDGKELREHAGLASINPWFETEFDLEKDLVKKNDEESRMSEDIWPPHNDRRDELSSPNRLDIQFIATHKTPEFGQWHLISGPNVSGVAFCLDDGRSLVFKGKDFNQTYVDNLNKQFPLYSRQSVFGGQFERLFNRAERLYMVRRTEASEFTIDTLIKARWSRSDCSNINRHSEFMDKFIEGQITRGSIPKWIRFEGQAQTLDSVAFLQFLSNPA